MTKQSFDGVERKRMALKPLYSRLLSGTASLQSGLNHRQDGFLVTIRKEMNEAFLEFAIAKVYRRFCEPWKPLSIPYPNPLLENSPSLVP